MLSSGNCIAQCFLHHWGFRFVEPLFHSFAVLLDSPLNLHCPMLLEQFFPLVLVGAAIKLRQELCAKFLKELCYLDCMIFSSTFRVVPISIQRLWLPARDMLPKPQDHWVQFWTQPRGFKSYLPWSKTKYLEIFTIFMYCYPLCHVLAILLHTYAQALTPLHSC